MEKVLKGINVYTVYGHSKDLPKYIEKQGGDLQRFPYGRNATNAARYDNCLLLPPFYPYIQESVDDMVSKGALCVDLQFIVDSVEAGRLLTEDAEAYSEKEEVKAKALSLGKRKRDGVSHVDDSAKKRKMVIENDGTVVDEYPEFVFPKCSVLILEGNSAGAMLKAADNYYLIQLYFDRVISRYFLFTRHGATDTAGVTEVTKFESQEEAAKAFKSKFYEVSQNNWDEYVEGKYENKGYDLPLLEKPVTYVPYSACGDESDSEEEKIPSFVTIPDELLLRTFEYLGLHELGALSIAARKFNSLLCDNDHFWITWHNTYLQKNEFKAYGKTYEEPHKPINAQVQKKKKKKSEDDEDEDEKEDGDDEEEKEEEEVTTEAKTIYDTLKEQSMEKSKDKRLLTLEKLALINKNMKLAFDKSKHSSMFKQMTAKDFLARKYQIHKYLGHLFHFERVAYNDDNDDEFETLLEQALEKKRRRNERLEELVIGPWDECCDGPEESVANWVIANRRRLPDLISLFYGDIYYENAMISGIEGGDVTPFLNTYPNLLHLKILGICEIQPVLHVNLMSFTFVTGGMNSKQLESVLSLDLPNLYHLELWLGTKDYGADFQLSQFDALLAKEENGMFPSLQYLGLRNCDQIDEMLPAIVTSNIVRNRIRILDISNGTLSKAGFGYIQQLKELPLLETVVSYHHYVPQDLVEQLYADGFDFSLDLTKNNYSPHDDYRYVCVGE